MKNRMKNAKFMSFILVEILNFRFASALPQAYSIAAIFDQDTDMKMDLMFVNAIKNINRLPGFLPPGVTLVPLIQKVSKDNSFSAERATCQVLSKGVLAVFGPKSAVNSEHIKSICDHSEVPFFESRSLGGRNFKDDDKPKYSSISLYPDPEALGDIVVGLILRYGWTEITLLYDTNDNLKFLRPIMEMQVAAKISRTVAINLKQLIKHDDEEYRTVLKEIVESEGENIVLSCELDILWSVLNQAQQIGIVTGKQRWLITNLDAHTLDFKPFKYDFTNFTLFRMTDPTSHLVMSSLKWIVEEEIRMGRSLDFTDFSGGLSLDAALLYDSVHLLGAAFAQLSHVQHIKPESLSCTEPSREFWTHGSSLINYMRTFSLPGLSGSVRFDDRGRRSKFEMDILNVLEGPGIVKVGSWADGEGFSIPGYPLDSQNKKVEESPMMNKTFIVTSIFNDPYIMLKEEKRLLVGNDRYEGMVPDMMQIISQKLHFNYTLRIVEDGEYGSFDENSGKWNGMIEEVLDGTADMALADLSITTQRTEAVEFSMPWMNLGISIIYQKPKKAPPSLLSFMMPFSDTVWVAMLAGFLLTALTTYFIGRFSPYEWFNPNFCILEPKEVETQWNISNSIWHTIGALMQQGTDYCPVALSTRFCVGIFYFFTLIMVSSYTANLAASLTAEILDRPITNAEDLAKQTQIKYGVVYCGSTCNFFKTSTFETYKTMWAMMSSPENKDKVMVRSNKDGVNKVISSAGGYAFMMESSSIQYIVQRKCDLAQIGGNLDVKGYGIATRPGSEFKPLLDSAILQMQEEGEFHKLKTKWWKQRRGGGKCDNSAKTSVKKLDLSNLGGIFLVTLCGGLLAGVSCLLELIYGTYADSQEFGTPWSYELKERVGFAFRCSTFGRKGRMASMRYKTGSRMNSEVASEVSSEEIYKGPGLKRRKSLHIHYPGW